MVECKKSYYERVFAMKREYKISGFCDEMYDGIIDQFEALNKIGIKYYEPRIVDGKTITDRNMHEIKTLKKIMQCYGITSSSIGSPIGKIKPTDDFDKHFELYKHTVEIANELDTKYIRMFSFFMPENENAEDYTGFVVEKLGKMADYAKENGVVLLHENEKGIYGTKASRCKTILEQVNSENMRAVFDFSNFVECEQDTIEAYEMLKPYIEYIHIKDCKNGGGVVPSGMGDGNIEEILKRLYAQGYEGFLSLEPHLFTYEVPENSGALCDSFAEVKAKRFVCAYNALCDILERI